MAAWERPKRNDYVMYVWTGIVPVLVCGVYTTYLVQQLEGILHGSKEGNTRERGHFRSWTGWNTGERERGKRTEFLKEGGVCMLCFFRLSQSTTLSEFLTIVVANPVDNWFVDMWGGGRRCLPDVSLRYCHAQQLGTHATYCPDPYVSSLAFRERGPNGVPSEAGHVDTQFVAAYTVVYISHAYVRKLKLARFFGGEWPPCRLSVWWCCHFLQMQMPEKIKSQSQPFL